MDEAERKHLAELLARYYEADERTAKCLVDEIVQCLVRHMKRRLQRERLSTDEQEDLHQQSSIAIFSYLAAGRAGGRHIENPISVVSQIVGNLVADTKRAHTPRRQMEQKISYIVNKSGYKNSFAVWQILAATYIGLKVSEGRPFVETDRYRAFQHDDTAFVQHGLNGRHPAAPGQVELWELMLKFLEWIETPLQRGKLVDHMLALQPIVEVWIESIDDIPRGKAPTLHSDESAFDWEACWQAICGLGSFGRDALLLHCDHEQLEFLTGQKTPVELLAQVLGVSLQEMQRLWEQLPLEDADIARRWKKTPNNVQVMRKRCREHISKRAGFPPPR